MTSIKKWPAKVKEVMAALQANADEGETEQTMYVEHVHCNQKDIWRIVCNYEMHNGILVYVQQDDKWYYQRMYGDFWSNDDLIRINGRLSDPMNGNHSEALSNARCWYTG